MKIYVSMASRNFGFEVSMNVKFIVPALSIAIQEYNYIYTFSITIQEYNYI